MDNWYQISQDQALEKLNSNQTSGLTQSEVAKRLAQYGPNEIKNRTGRSPWKILWEQLSGIFVVILIVAALISLFLQDYADAVVILLIVVLNAALGFQQEYKAEKSMAAIKRMAVPIVKVRRDGIVAEITARELAPGDITILETGNRVPADGRGPAQRELADRRSSFDGRIRAHRKRRQPGF